MPADQTPSLTMMGQLCTASWLSRLWPDATPPGDWTRVCSDASNIAMQCLRPLCHSGAYGTLVICYFYPLFFIMKLLTFNFSRCLCSGLWLQLKPSYSVISPMTFHSFSNPSALNSDENSNCNEPSSQETGRNIRGRCRSLNQVYKPVIFKYIRGHMYQVSE